MQSVLHDVRAVASSSATVLIRGETGTGKELVARAIHRLSPRHGRPFVIANCAAVPHELLESEAFGHVRGSFTGAVSNHVGYFESAADGTLLLDEVGDLHPDLQAKILRVLEDGSFRRVGSSKVLFNRARMLASTNQPLELLLERGRFREDLYYRLEVVPIDIPPLRERREDVLPLVVHFLQAFARACDCRPPLLLGDAKQALVEHAWWGNVRELKNVVHRLVLTRSGETLDADDICPLLNHRKALHRPQVVPLRDIERETILEALRRFHGNRTRTAQALGIGRRTLQNKLKRLGVGEPS
jgi:transcriptional regulator with GAF, ATPase, and Fis domain